MADNEERILVLTTNNEDGEWTQDGCFTNDRYAICSASMTKQEAIEIMAKAICKSDGICTSHDCENCTEWSGNDILVAEKALNALLER